MGSSGDHFPPGPFIQNDDIIPWQCPLTPGFCPQLLKLPFLPLCVPNGVSGTLSRPPVSWGSSLHGGWDAMGLELQPIAHLVPSHEALPLAEHSW